MCDKISTSCHSVASVAKNKADPEANESILSALSKRGPDGLDVLIEALEVEEDVHKRLIERIRKGKATISCLKMNEGGWLSYQCSVIYEYCTQL